MKERNHSIVKCLSIDFPKIQALKNMLLHSIKEVLARPSLTPLNVWMLLELAGLQITFLEADESIIEAGE